MGCICIERDAARRLEEEEERRNRAEEDTESEPRQRAIGLPDGEPRRQEAEEERVHEDGAEIDHGVPEVEGAGADDAAGADNE